MAAAKPPPNKGRLRRQIAGGEAALSGRLRRPLLHAGRASPAFLETAIDSHSLPCPSVRAAKPPAISRAEGAAWLKQTWQYLDTLSGGQPPDPRSHLRRRAGRGTGFALTTCPTAECGALRWRQEAFAAYPRCFAPAVFHDLLTPSSLERGNSI